MRIAGGLLLAAAVGGIVWLIIGRQDEPDFSARYAAAEGQIRARAAELDHQLDSAEPENARPASTEERSSPLGSRDQN